jgi:two-component system, NarL family, sensor histidine kinase DesK
MRLIPRLLPKNKELGWTPYVWLVYLSYFLVYPASRPSSALDWVLTAAGAAVFLGLYFWGFWQKGPRVLWSVAGILLLAVLFVPSNPGAMSFFIYAAAFCSHAGRPRLAMACIAGVLAVLAAATAAFHLPVYVWLPAGLFSILIGGVNVHYAEVSRANARLRATQEEVERLAQTAERERIGRDLHDLLGHTLSLITLKAELARKLVPRDPERAVHEMEELERISRDALREVRSVVSGYRAEGLAAEMARARLALEAAGVTLDPARETVLAMALREAVTNVVRHSGARTCRIMVEPVDGETEGVRLEVRDDGIGSKGRGSAEGMGLSVIRDRVEGLGGRLERRAEKGTVLVVTLPQRQEQAAAQLPHGGLAVESSR